jgi:hypothetical protein
MATTRFPAEQNPAVDPELPQPSGQSTITAPAPGEVAVANTNTAVLEAIGIPAASPQAVPVVTNQAAAEEVASSAPAAVEIFRAQQSTVTTVTNDAAAVDAAAANIPTGDQTNSTITVGEDESTAETQRLANQQAAAKQRTQEQQAIQARFNQPANGDWRVRLQLAPDSDYLYNSTNPGILAPLKASDGVIFPYTPTIQTSYNANYDTTDLVHSNYRGLFYKNSYVSEVNVSGVFTAQDTQEAEYVLAVIHFFRSVTKMFYGQDAERGTPPPLVYFYGLGQFQFNNHPCVVKSFNYSLPNDVDYIRTQPNNYGVNLLNRRVKAINSPSNTLAGTVARIGNAVDKLGNLLNIGALPKFGSATAAGTPGVSQQAVNNTSNATYVPTKIEIQLSLMPIQTRNQISQQFSLKGFANGDLLRGGFW